MFQEVTEDQDLVQQDEFQFDNKLQLTTHLFMSCSAAAM